MARILIAIETLVGPYGRIMPRQRVPNGIPKATVQSWLDAKQVRFADSNTADMDASTDGYGELNTDTDPEDDEEQDEPQAAETSAETPKPQPAKARSRPAKGKPQAGA